MGYFLIPMARVTIEDCLENVDNMYELIHLATRRTRQMYRGSDPTVKSKNRQIVTSLREIAAGHVAVKYALDDEAPLPGEL
jgi:DNA-directed RNA polymerase subunit omega